MNTELLSQHLHNLLLTLLLATNVLLLFKDGSPSLVKPSQARAEGSGIRKLQQEQLQQEHYEGIEKDGYNDGDVAFHHRSSNRNRRDQRDALYLFADVAWQEHVGNTVFDALDKNNDGRIDFCEFREMFLDGRRDLLALIIDQGSLQVGGRGFNEEDFDFENQLPEGSCPDWNGFNQDGRPTYIPFSNEEIFPEGRVGFIGLFPKRDWWRFMQEGLRKLSLSWVLLSATPTQAQTELARSQITRRK